MFGRRFHAPKHQFAILVRGCAPIPFAGPARRHPGPHRHHRPHRPHPFVPIQGRGCL